MLLFCYEGKKGSLVTVPGLSCRNIQDNGDLDSNGIYWIRPAGSLISFQGYCDKLAIGRKFTDQKFKFIMNRKRYEKCMCFIKWSKKLPSNLSHPDKSRP